MTQTLAVLLAPAILSVWGQPVPAKPDDFVRPTTTSPPPNDYPCATLSCALYDNWTAVNFTNSTRACRDAQVSLIGSFGIDAPAECRSAHAKNYRWNDCRSRYCEAYEGMVERLLHMGGPEYYGFDECRPLLDFNRTICEADYRDAEAFCECLCPTLHLLDAPPDCEADIMSFLLIGRRGPELSDLYFVSEYCATFLCSYLEKIGDPAPVNPTPGVPDTCYQLDLPFRAGHCNRLVSARPYNPCPWEQPHEFDDFLQCSDRTDHKVDDRNVDSWGVCNEHHFRWQCPRNYPVMCSDRRCAGEADYCCRTELEDCASGEVRACSLLFRMDLEEWSGKMWPSLAKLRAGTTSLDPLAEYLLRTFTTTPEPSFAEKIRPIVPWIIAGIGVIGVATTVIVCFCMSREYFSNIGSVLTGAPRILAKYKSDPVSVYMPTGNLDRSKGGMYELPPLPNHAAIDAEKADVAACEALASAVQMAEHRGPNHLCTLPGQTIAEEAPLRQAIADVQLRGLQARGGNADLLKRAERWLHIVDVERRLVVAGQNIHLPDIIGKHTTLSPKSQVVFALERGEEPTQPKAKSSYYLIENLSEALREAREAGASDILVKSETEKLTHIVARCESLPAERCVLDPEGEGIRLLPLGKKRAVWRYTGDSYTYEPETGTADGLDDPLPPRALLGNVCIDDARPVCADYSKKGACRLGRRCPWRHTVARVGDSIREPVLLGDI